MDRLFIEDKQAAYCLFAVFNFGREKFGNHGQNDVLVNASGMDLEAFGLFSGHILA